MIITSIACLVYIITGLWGVILFSKKLLALTRAQTNTIRNLDNYKLNESQEKLINQVSRYNSLFTLAASTSIAVSIALGVAAIVSVDEGSADYGIVPIMQCITLFDCVVNVICLFLQYSFATKYYNKYCVCIDKCWKSILYKQVKLGLKKRYAKPLETAGNEQEHEIQRIITESDSEKENNLK